MNSKLKTIRPLRLLVPLALLLAVPQTRAQQSTAFTYQGQLRDGGTNANGSYGMTFKLYDAVSGGGQIGSTMARSPTLANGLFSVDLDFGAVFEGAARWLDITVTNGPDSQTLTPRVQILAAPYALHSATAANLTGGGWNASVGDFDDVTNVMLFRANGALVLGLSTEGTFINGGLDVGGEVDVGGGVYAHGFNFDGGSLSAEFVNLSPANWFSATAPNGASLHCGNASVILQDGYVTLDTVDTGGPPHALAIDPSGVVRVNKLSVNGWQGELRADSMTVNSNFNAWGACNFGDVFAHSIESQNNLKAQGGVLGLYANFTGDVTARGYNTTSDRNVKEKFEPIDSRAVLERVASLRISNWNFKGDTAARHLGPMAQDFYAAFNLGADDKHIATVDADGVALAAIQGLNQKLDERDAEVQKLKSQNEALEKRLGDLEAWVKASATK